MSLITADIRDELYTRIALRKSLSYYTFNNFSIVRTWQPNFRLEKAYENYPNGVLFIIGSTPGDLVALARANAAVANQDHVPYVRDYGVHLSFQKPLRADFSSDYTIGDTLCELVQELEDTCRVPSAAEWAFNRLEYMKDENDVPFDFFNVQDNNIFAAYFTAFYRKVQPPNSLFIV